MRYRIATKPDLCNGCLSCLMACSLKQTGEFNQFRSAIWIESNAETGAKTHFICKQCGNPLCVKVCPAEASWKGNTPFDPPIYKDFESGILYLDTQKESCLRCNECMLACPFGAIRLAPEDGHLVTCDHCNGNPECVAICPTGALEFEKVTTVRTKKKVGDVK